MAAYAIVALLSLIAGMMIAKEIQKPSPPEQLSRSPIQLKEGKTLSATQVYERSSPSVAYIEATGEEGVGSGSGFVIQTGEVLTNAHVVKGADQIRVSFKDRAEHKAELLGIDEATDLALLSVEGINSLKPLPLGDVNRLAVGDDVVAIGNPFGLARTLTTGVVSARQRRITSPNGFTISGAVQTDAAINPGNSGGPLLNALGRVVGINSQIISQTNQSSGIGFAVPINTAKRMLAELRSGEISYAYLGVSGARDEDGALITEVVEDQAAEEAGVREGDIVTHVDSSPVGSMQSLQIQVAKYEPGDEITLTLNRAGDTVQVPVTLGERPEEL